MLIDCDQCAMQDTDACGECVVTVLLSEGPVDLDGDEAAALSALAEVGLVPRLKLVPLSDPQSQHGAQSSSDPMSSSEPPVEPPVSEAAAG